MNKAVDQRLVEARQEEEGLYSALLDTCSQINLLDFTYHHSSVGPDLVGHSLVVGSLAVDIVVEGVFDQREEELRKMVVEVDKTLRCFV